MVDVQNDFADPEGSLFVPGAEEIVPLVNVEIDRARTAGAFVVYTQDWHPPDTPHFQKDGGIWPVHCVRDTWGAAFHPRLDVEGEVVRKGVGGEDGYSGFSLRDARSGETTHTVLGEMLQDRGIERVVICGLATDYCVVETAVDARERGYATEVLTAAVRAVNLRAGDDEAALDRMREADAVLV